MIVYAVVLDTMGAASFTVAMSEILLTLRRRGRDFSMSIGVTSLFTAAYCLACAGQYNVAEAAQSVPWLRAEAVFMNLMGYSYLWFVSGVTRTVPKLHLRLIGIWFALSSIVQVIGFGTLTWDPSQPSIKVVGLPFGWHVTYREVMAGPLTNVQWAAGALVFVYVFAVLIRFYRSGNKRDGRFLLIAASIIFAAMANDFAVSSGFYSFLYLTEYAWLAVTVFVGYQRSNEIIEAASVKDALAESEEKLRTLIDQSSEAIILADEQGMIIEYNAAAERLTGIPVSFALGRRAIDIIAGLGNGGSGSMDGPQAAGSLFREIARPVDGSDGERRVEGELLRPDGTTRFFRQDIFPIRTNERYRLGSIAHDITELRLSNERVLASLEEKNILLKEIHHRVKNNLQVISSLLYMQKGKSLNPIDCVAIIEDARNRIHSMALIHDDLYRSEDFQQIRFGDYVRRLSARLLTLYSTGKRIDLVFDVDDSLLGIDQAIPCGLILNELFTNALKYAFPPDFQVEDPMIRIAFNDTGSGRVELAVSDNGVGLPVGFDMRTTQTLGMQIVTTLERQLGGTVRIGRGTGTSIRLEFPVPAKPVTTLDPPRDVF